MKLLILPLLAAVSLIFITGCIGSEQAAQGCGTDMTCFAVAAKTCTLSNVTDVRPGITTYMAVKGGTTAACDIHVEVLDAPGAPEMVGKSMVCTLPSIQINFNNKIMSKDVLTKCNGPLANYLLGLAPAPEGSGVVTPVGTYTIQTAPCTENATVACSIERCGGVMTCTGGTWTACIKTDANCGTAGQKCSDGTAFGQCSSNKPAFCDNNLLVSRCSICGCLAGLTCRNNTCITAASGGGGGGGGSGGGGTTPACGTGETHACTTTDGCAGTQNCTGGSWDTCVKTNPACVCTVGQTQGCTTTDNCAGTQICLANMTWDNCTKTNASCGVITSQQPGALASGAKWGTYSVKIWNATTGTAMLTMSGHTSSVTSVAWSQDGSKIASSSLDKTIKIWDAYTGTEIRTLSGHAASITSMAWSAGGKIVSGGLNETMFWNSDTGELLTNLTGLGWVNSTTGSPDGTKFAVGYGNGSIVIYDSTGNMLKTIQAYPALPNCTIYGLYWINWNFIAWSPDSSKIASQGTYSSVCSGFPTYNPPTIIKIWDASTGDLIKSMGQVDGGGSIAWSPDSSKIAAAQSRFLTIWDVSTSSLLQNISVADGTCGFSLAWNPGSFMIATSSGGGNDLRLWNATSGASVTNITTPGTLLSLAWKT